MTSAQVVEASVNVILNSPSQDCTHLDDRTLLNCESSFKTQLDVFSAGALTGETAQKSN